MKPLDRLEELQPDRDTTPKPPGDNANFHRKRGRSYGDVVKEMLDSDGNPTMRNHEFEFNFPVLIERGAPMTIAEHRNIRAQVQAEASAALVAFIQQYNLEDHPKTGLGRAAMFRQLRDKFGFKPEFDEGLELFKSINALRQDIEALDKIETAGKSMVDFLNPSRNPN